MSRKSQTFDRQHQLTEVMAAWWIQCLMTSPEQAVVHPVRRSVSHPICRRSGYQSLCSGSPKAMLACVDGAEDDEGFAPVSVSTCEAGEIGASANSIHPSSSKPSHAITPGVSRSSACSRQWPAHSGFHSNVQSLRPSCTRQGCVGSKLVMS